MAPGKDDLDSALADLEVSLGANDPDLEKLVSCDFVRSKACWLYFCV